jgi:hypothetical protein
LLGIAVLLAIVFIDWPAVIDKVRRWWAARHGRPAPQPIRELVLSKPPPDVTATRQ